MVALAFDRVLDVLALFAAGLSAEQILEEMPDLETKDLKAALLYASRKFNHSVLVAWQLGRRTLELLQSSEALLEKLTR